MLSRKIHRTIGLVMLVPMIAWAITGLVFFLKPGYEGAYEILKLKTYPLDQGTSIPSGANWQEVSLVKSVLGSHLLVKSGDQALHLNPATLETMPVPDHVQLAHLFNDSISHNIERYGSIKRIEKTTAYTTTNIVIALDWNKLRFTQSGYDREVIDLLYKIHYLQWTPWPTVNQIFGIFGLVFLVALSVFGIKIYVSNRG